VKWKELYVIFILGFSPQPHFRDRDPQRGGTCALGATLGTRSRTQPLCIKAFKGGKSNRCILTTAHPYHPHTKRSAFSSLHYRKEKHFRVRQREHGFHGKLVTALAPATGLRGGCGGRERRGRAEARAT
jgi:hypothetical protein